MPQRGEQADAALLKLLHCLRNRDYRFVTPTPATHARVVARADRRIARTLPDILGWSLPFDPAILDPELLVLLKAGGVLTGHGDRLRATVRVSSLGDRLFLHSAFPTDATDAIFFGPDSYRFADLIAAELALTPPPAGARIVDIGTGSGVGAIVAAGACVDAAVTMTDINPAALRLARINACAAGFTVAAVQTDGLHGVDEAIDLAIANPPYIIDDAARAYRHGGGMLGAEVALDMARMAVARLAPGGRFILYTGSPIVDGADALATALGDLAQASGCSLRYRETDPDVFGEELEKDAYRDVERIALIACVISRPAPATRSV